MIKKHKILKTMLVLLFVLVSFILANEYRAQKKLDETMAKDCSNGNGSFNESVSECFEAILSPLEELPIMNANMPLIFKEGDVFFTVNSVLNSRGFIQTYSLYNLQHYTELFFSNLDVVESGDYRFFKELNGLSPMSTIYHKNGKDYLIMYHLKSHRTSLGKEELVLEVNETPEYTIDFAYLTQLNMFLDETDVSNISNSILSEVDFILPRMQEVVRTFDWEIDYRNIRPFKKRIDLSSKNPNVVYHDSFYFMYDGGISIWLN